MMTNAEKVEEIKKNIKYVGAVFKLMPGVTFHFHGKPVGYVDEQGNLIALEDDDDGEIKRETEENVTCDKRKSETIC